MEENIVKNEIEENVTVDSSVAVEKSAEEVERDLADEIFLDEVKKEDEERNAIVAERDEYKKKYLYAIAELENTKKTFRERATQYRQERKGFCYQIRS